MRSRFHYGRQRTVHQSPGLARLLSERSTQSLLERPDQRGADRIIMMVLHAVANVPLAKATDSGDQLIELVQTAHGEPDHLHELLALLLHVRVSEHRAQCGVELEQA